MRHWARLASGAPRALAAAFAFERDRWALWLPVALAAGIGIYFDLSFEPPAWTAVYAGLICLAAAVIASRTSRTSLGVLLALVAAVALGFAVAKLRTEQVGAPVLATKIGPTGIDGRVISSEQHGKGVRIVLAVEHIRGLPVERAPARVRVSVRSHTELLVPGAFIHLTAVLMPPPGPTSPGDYDFGRWAFFERIGGVGYAYGGPKPLAPLRAPTPGEIFRAKLEQLRNAMTAHIRAVVPAKNSGITVAMITGDRGGISEDDNQAYRDSGLAHVISISGLHLALAGGLFFWLVRALLALIPPIALRYPIKKWAAVAALLAAGFYLLISGADPPAMRSYIMLAMMFLSILFDRPALSMRAVALAATLILLFSPESLVQPGFQMSFAAVIALIAMAEWESRRPRKTPLQGLAVLQRAWRYVFASLLVSTVAGLANAPFAIFHFDRSAQYGMLANLIALPIVTFIVMPAATAALVLMPFGLDDWALVIMGRGVGLMTAVAHWVAQLPGAAAMVPAWPLSALLLLTFGGLWIALWRERWRWLGLAPLFAGLVLTQNVQRPDLLIGRDAQTVAIRLGNGRLGFLRAPKDDFTAESWLKRDGDRRLPVAAVASARDGVRCDAYGCIALLKDGARLAFASRSDALAEDCANNDLVISSVPAQAGCSGPRRVFDSGDIAASGGYALWLGPPLKAVAVQDARGKRPWSTLSYFQ